MAFAIFVLGVPDAAGGQWARGAGPDASPIGAGTVRVSFAPTWDRWREAYSDGALNPLGARFSFDSLGAAVMPGLAALESAVQSVSAQPGFRASLGRSVVQWRSAYETTPVDLAIGVGRRLTVGATIPFVTSIARVDATLDPANRTATVGINPALATPAIAQANGTLLSQLDAAAAFVTGRVATCAAVPTGTGCAPFVAAPAAARALAEEASAFATGLAGLYGGRGGQIGALFLPLAAGSAHAAMVSRLDALKTQLSALGAPAVTANAPIGAGAPLTTADFQRVLTDSTFGIRAAPLATIVRRGVGDVTAYAQFTWDDGQPARNDSTRARWWRSAVGLAYRSGNGAEAQPDALTPVAIGDHQADIELTSITDVGLGHGLSVTATATLTVQRPDALQLRVAPSTMPFPEAFRTWTLARDRGDIVSLAVYPRWAPAEAVAIAAYYGYRRRGADQLSGVGVATDATGASVTLDPSLGAPPDASSEHRIGASLAYSTLAAHARGEARWPLEVAVTHFQTTAGPSGVVPKVFADAVTVRWYWSRRAAPARRATR